MILLILHPSKLLITTIGFIDKVIELLIHIY